MLTALALSKDFQCGYGWIWNDPEYDTFGSLNHLAAGWGNISEVSVVDLANQFSDVGVAAIIYTDISRDGMMQGCNVEATIELASKSKIPIIASGGIAKLADIIDLKAAGKTDNGAGITGAIIGRAIYEGALDLRKAQRYCDNEDG